MIAKRGRVPRPPTSSHQRKYVPEPRLVPSGDGRRPTFRFAHVDRNRFCLHEWNGQEIKVLVRRLGELEDKTWRQIKESKGDGFTVCTNKRLLPKLPPGVPQDAVVFERRANQKLRLFCYSDSQDSICIIWFDRKHEIYNMS